jgi:hypothetical protein
VIRGKTVSDILVEYEIILPEERELVEMRFSGIKVKNTMLNPYYKGLAQYFKKGR